MNTFINGQYTNFGHAWGLINSRMTFGCKISWIYLKSWSSCVLVDGTSEYVVVDRMETIMEQQDTLHRSIEEITLKLALANITLSKVSHHLYRWSSTHLRTRQRKSQPGKSRWHSVISWHQIITEPGRLTTIPSIPSFQRDYRLSLIDQWNNVFTEQCWV